MVGCRRRRRAKVVPALVQCLMFAGQPIINIKKIICMLVTFLNIMHGCLNIKLHTFFAGAHNFGGRKLLA